MLPLTAVSHFLFRQRSSESTGTVLILVLCYTLSPPAPHNPLPCAAALSPCHSQSTPHSVASSMGRSPTQYSPCSVALAHTSVSPPLQYPSNRRPTPSIPCNDPLRLLTLPTTTHGGVHSTSQLPSVDTYYNFNPAQADFAYAVAQGASGLRQVRRR